VDIERRVRQIRWPDPSADLRRQVVSTISVADARVTWSDRVWFSRAWRIAAAAIVLAAIGVESFSGTADRTRSAETPLAVAEAHAVDDAGRELGLPAQTAERLARSASAGERRSAADRATLELLAAEGDRR
jgi:hypothetical protein